jgi:hypothetical protein
MNTRVFFILSAIVIFFSGLASVAYPQLMFDMWGSESNQAGLIITRLSGALEIGLGLILWLARNAAAGEVRRAIVIGGFATYSLFSIIMLFSIAGVSNPMVWMNIALYVLLAVGFAYFTFVQRE